MRVLKLRSFGALVALFFVSVSSQAALVSVLSGQAVYDSDLDATWISDGNLVVSNNFGVSVGTASGQMIYSDALIYINAMNAANYLGFNDWRLPATPDSDPGCSGSNIGFNCTGSELGHLFYDEFGVSAGADVSTGIPSELAKFSNLQSGYWSTFAPSAPSTIYRMAFANGEQKISTEPSGITVMVLAVRDGSVVPVPAAVWLFGSALGLLGWIKRKAH